MFVLIVSVALFGSAYSDGYWDIELSPQSITAVPFDCGHISVWEHARSPGRYYAMPLVVLDHESATTVENILTGHFELSFKVLMWSIEAKEAVFRHLKASMKNTVTMEHVEMLPMEKIRIVWRDRNRPISNRFKLVEHWKSNTHLPAEVKFQFTCSDGPSCETLKQAMKTTPNMFNALELEYVINGQRSARRVLTVTGDHVLKGKLFTRLNNMPSAATNGERYLTSDDLKTITSETVSNVISSVVTDSDYVDTGDEVSLKDVLMNELMEHEVSSKNLQPLMWNSVFWNETWARPDKLTQYFNKVLSKDTSDSRKFLLDESQRSHSSEGNAGGSFLNIIKVSGGGSGSSNSQSKVQKEDVLNTLRERHSDIEWTGEVFKVKPMKLYRLNLSTLSKLSTVVSANIQVRRYESVLSIKLRIREANSTQTPCLSPQLVEARLSEKISQTIQKIVETDRRLQGQITNSNNEWKGRLGPIDAKLSSLPGWSLSSHFCIFANGNCPPGFSRHEGHLRAINQYAANGNYIRQVTWGSSNIRCHGNCGQYGNWVGELNLAMCCR